MLFFKKATVDWIVVFLGNPGAEYTGTRHNAGFYVGDKLADDLGVKFDRAKFHALTCRCEFSGTKLLLLKPTTFMNLSGIAASEAAGFYKVPTDHILVISDDVSLPIGKLRIRKDGSAGGHNGLKDIGAKCGGFNFPRIKVGVGTPPDSSQMISWVLGKISGEDLTLFNECADRAKEAIKYIVTNNVESAMNKFNSNIK